MNFKLDEKYKNVLKGIPAAPGVYIANAFLYKKEVESVSKEQITDVEQAIKSLDEAIEKSKSELKKIFGLAVDKLGEKRAAIFEAQIMILDDPYLLDTIHSRIRKEKIQPEFIVDDEISKYQKLMIDSNESYMKERSHDIEDIKNRIIRNIRKKKWISKIKNEVVVVTNNITPADTVLFSRVNVKGYVTDTGGLTSHAAIVARSLKLPAVLGVHDASTIINENDELIIDGYHGYVIVNPTHEQRNFYLEKMERLSIYNEELSKLRDLPAETIDGRKIIIRGNLDLSEELILMFENGAEGIGLVRTEQLFDGLNHFPDEEEQYQIYSDLAEKIYPEKVIIRAFDIGGDKVLPLDVKEPNPFLGWRGIRFLLDNTDLFKTQIKAVLRASTHKNIKFMIPMVTSLKEIKTFKEYVAECKTELKTNNISFDENISLGIMVEVPSAVIMASEFAKEVDFFSIGTNDLIQYILAVDRGNEIVNSLYQEFHPAIVRTIFHLIDNAKSGGAKVSICGEMAADPLAVPLLVGLGMDSISVSAASVPTVKKIVRSIKYSDVENLAKQCLKYSSEEQIRTALTQFFEKNVTDNTERIFQTKN
ncbi:MAG: phosphoenolpyruvate--protein phosphotransferase [Melioribacteraceae bacterium]|nr:phosphoenolpyruvate--protein phosphotransferase [Melioribacteraceae bacterium]